MKRITPLKVILWSLLLIAGIAFAVLAVLLRNLDILFWPLAAIAWIIDAVLIFTGIMHHVRRLPKTGGTAFAGNKATVDRIFRETSEAVSRYLSTVNRKGLTKHSALYERPWFLMCGTSGSGKTSLLRGSGLDFPVHYPSERDGAQISGSNQIRWYFGNEAVWIDTPGSCMEDAGKDEWQSLVESLRKVRPVRPVDGVALAVNISEVLSADEFHIKGLAQILRSRIDDLIAGWGMEFPVYLLFNHCDEIPGFAEYFSEQIAAGGDEVFGATISQRAKGESSPRMVFLEEFNVLNRSLNDVRLDRLYKESANAKKRMICRFVIHFSGIRQKLGVLAAELFKPSSYVGKPIFRGFYFTSCSERIIAGATGQAAGAHSVSATIINHPFNPDRAFGGNASRPSQVPRGQTVEKKELRSLFVLPLFRGIMVRDKPLAKATRGRSRQQMMKHWGIIGGMGIIALFVTAFLIAGYFRINGFYSQVVTSLSSLPSEKAPLMEQYSALSQMQGVMGTLQKYEEHVPLGMGIGLYRGGALLSSLKSGYFHRLRRCMIAPAAKYLEYDIRGKSENPGELSGEDYDRLYRSLKAYLSISEAARSHPKDIDTVFLKAVLFDAIRQTLLSGSGSDRLPEKVETVLQNNMGLLMMYLRRGELPVIQENQRMVADARLRLRRLPGAISLYEGIMGRLTENATQLSLEELIGRQGPGILSSDKTISALYSQQGWDQSIKPALKEAANNPYKVDWVIGLTKQDIPEGTIDKGRLYDEMAAAFCDDFQKNWCGFIGSVGMEPFVDIRQSARMLQKLAGDQSEIEKLLQAVGKITLIKKGGVAEKAGNTLVKAGAKLNSGLAKPVGGPAKTFTFPPATGGSPFENVTATFDELRSFSASSAGALSGFAGYKEKLLMLADKLNSMETGGEDQVLILFTGRDDDPLAAGWKFTKNTIGLMPEDLSSGLGALLLKPLEFTGAAVSQTLILALNARWQTEVLKPFADRFSGRYPFSAKGEDASWNEVMDFFRPVTGTIWGFYDRVLSSYIVKTSSGWMVRRFGGMSFNFNPELSATLSDAEEVRNIFFKPDGTGRQLEITITPAPGNKNAGTLIVDGQTLALPQGGKSVRVNWPFDGAQARGSLLKFRTGKDFSEEVGFKGQWGLMKLIGAARTNKVNSTTFAAKWQVNVQNMYTLFFEARLQVASSYHPFIDPVFQRFTCPLQLIDTGK